MQIMPGTGRGLARRLGISGLSNRQLYNADLSLRLGTFHFKTVLKRFNHRLEYTLAGYNAGEHRVDAWLAWEDLSDPEEFAGKHSLHRDARLRAIGDAQRGGLPAALFRKLKGRGWWIVFSF